MTNGIEEQLREGIDRLTADARVPAGMLGRARQHNRRRRIAIQAAAAGTAVVAAAAVIAVTGTARPARAPLRAQTLAYVTGRTQHALAAVPQGKAIEEVSSTAYHGAFGFTVLNMALGEQPNPVGSAVLPGVLGGVKAQRTTSWYYRGRMLQEGFSATGKLVFASGIAAVTSPTGKHVTETYGAAYLVRIRWRAPLGATIGRAPKPTCGNPLPGPAAPDLRAAILKALSCKLLTLDGRQQVGGVDAIKLIMESPFGLRVRETFWLDTLSYLPLRTSIVFLGSHGPRSILTDNFRWLPPTRANLAALHATISGVPIPAGFRALPSTDLPLAGFH